MNVRRIPWVLAIALALLIGAVPAAAQSADAEETKEEVLVKRIKMTAENFKWTPSVIRVAPGTRLMIEFQNYDAPHSFELKAYKIKVPLSEGKPAKVEFVADRVGVFKWKCGRPCGNGCPKMRGKLIVE